MQYIVCNSLPIPSVKYLGWLLSKKQHVTCTKCQRKRFDDDQLFRGLWPGEVMGKSQAIVYSPPSIVNKR